MIAMSVALALIAATALWNVPAARHGSTSAPVQAVRAADKPAKVVGISEHSNHEKKSVKEPRTTASTTAKSGSSLHKTGRISTAVVSKSSSAQNSNRTASKTRPKPKPASPGGVVVIDAGHQATADTRLEPIGPGASAKKAKVAGGASGVCAPHAESALNLAVALKLRDILRARGVHVVMIRTSQHVDIPNSQRAKIANRAHAALFIRLHCDGISDGSIHGFATLVPGRNRWTGPIVPSSAKAGRLVQAAAVHATGAGNRGVTSRSDLSGFNWSKVPTVLCEMGFMSNRAEDRLLTQTSYQRKLANGIANGVISYLSAR